MDEARDLDADVEAAIQAALRGEASLYELMSVVLTGKKPNPQGDQWTSEQERIFSRAGRRYLELKKQRAKDRPAPTPTEVWDALDFVMGGLGAAWWTSLSRMQWPRVGARLGLTGDRAAIYQLVTKQGWAFTGKGVARRCTAAPCAQCSTPVDPATLIGRLCSTCAT